MRMRPITLAMPKPMIPLLRKPVMETIIAHLQSFGVEDIVVNTSYMSPMIQNYFRDGERFGVNLSYSFEGSMVGDELKGDALGSAGGMKKIQNFSGFFDDTFMVLCGDAYLDFDIEELYRFHKARGSVATIVLRDVDPSEASRYGVVKTDVEGRIVQSQDKPSPQETVSTTINTGIYMFEPQVLDLIPGGQHYDIGSELLPMLVEQGHPLYGLPMQFNWLDIGSVAEYFHCMERLLRGEVSTFKRPGQVLAPGVFGGISLRVDLDAVNIQGPVYIGSGTRIEPGATIIGPTSIGSNCVIESGARIERCHIDDFKRIQETAEICDLMLIDQYVISRNGSALDLKELQCQWLIDDARCENPLDPWQRALRDAAMVRKSA